MRTRPPSSRSRSDSLPRRPLRLCASLRISEIESRSKCGIALPESLSISFRTSCAMKRMRRRRLSSVSGMSVLT